MIYKYGITRFRGETHEGLKKRLSDRRLWISTRVGCMRGRLGWYKNIWLTRLRTRARLTRIPITTHNDISII